MKFKKKNPKDRSFTLGVAETAKGTGSILGLGVLTLQKMKQRGKLGAPVNDKNLMPGTTTIYFINERAITDLISELGEMLSNMRSAIQKSKKTVEILNASNRDTSRHTYLPVQAPRKRKKR